MVVVGAASDLEDLVEHYRASTVFVPSGSLPAKVLREFVGRCFEARFQSERRFSAGRVISWQQQDSNARCFGRGSLTARSSVA